MRKRWPAAVALLAACAAGCADATPPAPDPGPPAWVAPACPADSPEPRRGGIPDGFAVSWVLRCPIAPEQLTARAAGTVPERADTPATELLATLRRPSDPRTSRACPAMAVVPPYVVLVGADGRGLAPRLPTDGCGLPRHEALDLLDALPYRAVSG